jgi:hypothetical protein
MSFGRRRGPLWATTPTRQLRRSTPARMASLERIAGMSPEEYVQRIADMSPGGYSLQAEAAPMHWDWFHRQEAATEAEPQGLRDEFGEGGRPGAR